MKLKFFIISLMCLLSLCAYSQKKVAVYVTGENSGINKILGDRLVDAFVNSGKYIAIERTSSFLAELSKEQSYQRTGAVSDLELSRLGEQFGVQYVCVADVSDAFGEKYVSARLIDVESAEVINSANTSSPMQSMDELLEVTSAITIKLTGKTAKEIADERAAYEAEQEIKKAEAEKRISAYETRCATHEAIMKRQLEQGYLQVGNYYITFPVSNGKFGWSTANTYKNDCSAGGYHDWRFPQNYELQQIQDNLENMYTICNGYVYNTEIAQDVYSYSEKTILDVYTSVRTDIKRYYDYSKGIEKVENNINYVDGFWLVGDRYYYSCFYKTVKKASDYENHMIMLIRNAE